MLSEIDVLALLQSLVTASSTGSTSVATAAGTRLVLLGGLRALQVFKTRATPTLHASIDSAMRPLYTYASYAPCSDAASAPSQYAHHTMASAEGTSAATHATQYAAQRQQFSGQDEVSTTEGTSSTTVSATLRAASCMSCWLSLLSVLRHVHFTRPIPLSQLRLLLWHYPPVPRPWLPIW